MANASSNSCRTRLTHCPLLRNSVLGTTSPIANHLADTAMTRFGPLLLGPFVVEDILSVNAMDYYGIWRRTEAMLAVSLRGDDSAREFAFEIGDGGHFRYMGHWSDGRPVKEILTKAAFGSWFDVEVPFDEAPTAPDDVLISGAPVITFRPAAPHTVSLSRVVLASFGRNTPAILSVRFDGPSPTSFRWAPGTAPVVDAMLGIEFRPTVAGEHSATLAVTYEVGGAIRTVTRQLVGVAR